MVIYFIKGNVVDFQKLESAAVCTQSTAYSVMSSIHITISHRSIESGPAKYSSAGACRTELDSLEFVYVASGMSKLKWPYDSWPLGRHFRG